MFLFVCLFFNEMLFKISPPKFWMTSERKNYSISDAQISCVTLAHVFELLTS